MAHAPDVELYWLCLRRSMLHMLHAAASERFRSGEWTVRFPEGMFRPLGGYVGTEVRAAMRAPPELPAS